MTKPHEQVWTYCETSKCVTNEAGYDVTAYDADEEEMRLIAAAPAMARALMEDMTYSVAGEMHHWGCPVTTGVGACVLPCAHRRTVLKEAGVLP